MSNLLRLADYREQIEQQQVEVRKVSLDDGYTQIPNELLLAIAKFGFTQRQRTMIDVVILKTLTWKKEFDWISGEQFIELGNFYDKAEVSRLRTQLIEMNVLLSKGTKTGLNLAVSEWKKESTKVVKKAQQKLVRNTNRSCNNLPTTKETITKNNKNPPLTPQGENLPAGKSKAKRLAEKIDYQAIADAWNQANENSGSRLPFVEKVNDGRKRTIKKFLGELKESTVSCAGNYFRAFFNSATPHHFGENDRGWKASFDFAIRPDVVLRVREGAL